MKRLTTVVGFLILTMHGFAQTTYPELQLPDSIKEATPEWIDVDNDGLLDITLFMKSDAGKSYIGLIKGDTLNPVLEINETFPIINFTAYLFADYDRDNAIDVMVSGEKNGIAATTVYRNKGNLLFEEHATTLPPFTIARFADLDDDATPEFIASGEDINGYYFRILKEVSPHVWTLVHDSLKLKCTGIEVMDADGDGTKDLFVSGKIKPDSLLSGFLINNGKFYLSAKHTVDLAGNTSVGDLNGDGFFEVVLMAADKNGQWHTKKFEHVSGGYEINDFPTVLKDGKSFIADFNYDGVADINFLGITATDAAYNTIQYSDGQSLLLPVDLMTHQRFADIEHDGDLELLGVRNTGALSLEFPQVLNNAKNLGPGVPSNAVALPVFNRVFMYWDKPVDDHTPSDALTYDVFLNGIRNYQAGEFDLLNEKRLSVTHGNNGFQNFRLLKNVSSSGLSFAIQSIDNSFHAGSACIGGGGAPTACVNVTTTEEISACTNENIIFEAPVANALWFSFADGYLGTGNDLDFASSTADTLFYYAPMGASCSSLKAWVIKINDDTFKIENKDKYACLGSNVEFKVEADWEDVTWSSYKRGTLAPGNPLIFNVTEPDSIFVSMMNEGGCRILRKTALKISKPEINLSADQYKIVRGGTVQLQASGAQRYVWAPATGLNQTDIPNPVASPTVSIQYTVTGYDSLDCQAQATVSIFVEEVGFIPSLFSPNADGQNDQLKIYGLGSAQRFSISIYDREGLLVYKTSDLLEAVQQGWDGTKNGTAQPPGVYFWKVEGELPSGPLRLNGKDAGSVVLIR